MIKELGLSLGVNPLRLGLEQSIGLRLESEENISAYNPRERQVRIRRGVAKVKFRHEIDSDGSV